MLFSGLTIAVLFTFLLILKRPKLPRDKYLILWYSAFCLQLAGFYLNMNADLSNPLVLFFSFLRFPLLLLYSPLFYFYYYKAEEKRIRWMLRLIHFMPFILFSIYFLVLSFRGAEFMVRLIQSGRIYRDPVYLASRILFFAAFPVYLVISKPRFSFKQWEGLFTLATIALYAAALFFGISWNIEMIYFGLALVLSILTIIGFTIPQVIHDKNRLKRSIGIKPLPEHRDLESEKTRLTQYMKEHKPYLNQELTLQSLSSECGIPQYLLSHIINKGFSQSFTDYISRYRITEFLTLYSLHSGDTIPGLAAKAGFPSKPTFYRIFKSIYGSSPTMYLKNSTQIDLKDLSQ